MDEVRRTLTFAAAVLAGFKSEPALAPVAVAGRFVSLLVCGVERGI